MFQKELVKLGIDWVVNYYPYVNPVPVNTQKLERMLISHIKKGSTIAIFPDSDVDGILSALEMKSLLELLGCKNVKLLKLTEKSHGLNSKFVDQVLDVKADLLVTVDSSTNNREAIEKLSMYEVDHIIIDHHIVTEDLTTYPENVVVVNSKMTGNEEFNNVSAGMLCYIVIHNLLHKVKIDKTQMSSFLNKMYILGYITLYTDCMNLADKYNLSVICNVEQKKNFTPRVITQFMTEYDFLSRNFIEYRFAPRVNAVIRRERFDILYDLFFKRCTDEERALLLEQVEHWYVDGKNAVTFITDNLPVETHEYFVVGNLDTLEFKDDFNSVIKNYTGLIANQLASRYQKLAVVVSTDKVESYKGSVRDPYSRQSLNLFKRICDCGGHMSAFGLHLLKRDYKSFRRQLEILAPALKDGIQQAQIVLDGELFDERLRYQIRSIAEYNEISGNTLPKAVIRKRIGHSQKVRREEKFSEVVWDGMKIICFCNIYVGDTIIFTPTLSATDVVCFGVPATNK